MQKREVTQKGLADACGRIYESSSQAYYELKERILRREPAREKKRQRNEE